MGLFRGMVLAGGFGAGALLVAAGLPGMARAQAICAEGARAVRLPASFGMETDAADLVAEVQARSPAPPQGLIYSDWADLPWAEVLAERAAALPPELADLPLLELIADIEAETGNAAMTMALGTTGVLLPQIPEALRRHGLEERARVFEAALTGFPDWSEGIEARIALLSLPPEDPASPYHPQNPLSVALIDYPLDKDLRLRTYLLGLKDPAIRARWLDRARAASPDARLDWLLERLSQDCRWNDWWEPEAGLQVLSVQGRAQGQLMLMRDYLWLTSDRAMLDYLGTGPAALAPELGLVLEERGLRGTAELLRDGMELYGTPWPRDESLRGEKYQAVWGMPDLPEALTEVTTPKLRDAMRAEMLKIANEAGLLPR